MMIDGRQTDNLDNLEIVMGGKGVWSLRGWRWGKGLVGGFTDGSSFRERR